MTNYDEPTVIEKLLAEKKVKVKTFTVDEVIAMFKDLDLQIENITIPLFNPDGMDGFYWGQGLVKDLVQQKINTLKGEENESLD